jgi:hypothetical protein
MWPSFLQGRHRLSGISDVETAAGQFLGFPNLTLGKFEENSRFRARHTISDVLSLALSVCRPAYLTMVTRLAAKSSPTFIFASPWLRYPVPPVLALIYSLQNTNF